ncbi:MAG: hypothetical protein J6C26_02765 [Clostridia bacterium]|nr:hypothetical protein [Clostridia bacterium]
MGGWNHPVLGNDQWNESIVLYDLDCIDSLGSLEQGEIQRWSTDHISGMTYREDTVFGDVFLTVGRTASLVTFPEGKVLWSTDSPGRNSHAAELLPGGNLIVANSSGDDFRLFFTSALLTSDRDSAATYVSYPFFHTHGVLWDPVYQCLWVLGAGELAAYRAVGEGVSQRLEPIPGKRWSISEYGNGGHDLNPDPTDSRYLFCTPLHGVLRFDKQTGTFSRPYPAQAAIATRHCKSFSCFPDGTFVYTSPALRDDPKWNDWWKQNWCTDRIVWLRVSPDGTFEEREIFSDQGAFYKCKVFYGQYL